MASYTNPAVMNRGIPDTLNAAAVYGLQGRLPDTTTNNPIPALERSVGPGVHSTMAHVWHPSNPLFWFGLFLAGTVGLVGFATEFRVGPARVGGSIGPS